MPSHPVHKKGDIRDSPSTRQQTLPSVAGVDQSLAEGVRPSKAEWPAPGGPPGPNGVGREGLLTGPQTNHTKETGRAALMGGLSRSKKQQQP
jgi:hypothetical protein